MRSGPVVLVLCFGLWPAAALAADCSSAGHCAGSCSLDGGKHYRRLSRSGTDVPVDFSGECVCVNETNGKVAKRLRLVHGKEEGPYESYDLEGQLQLAATYRAGKLDGLLRSYRNGVLAFEGNCAAGERRGVQKEYADGKVERVYFAESDADRAVPPRHGSYELDAAGRLHNLACGQIPIGPEDAPWCGFGGKRSTVSLYEGDGKLYETAQYLDGREDGTFRRYSWQGQLEAETRWVKGNEDAEKTYGESGALVHDTDCEGGRGETPGREACTAKTYFPDTKGLEKELVVKDGKLVKEVDYFQNGREKFEIAAAGPDRYAITGFDDRGRTTSKGTYVEGNGLGAAPAPDGYVPDGTLEQYADGRLWKREGYKEGERQGPSVDYEEMGGHTLREETVYDQGKLVARKKYVDDKLKEEDEYFPDGSLKKHEEH